MFVFFKKKDTKDVKTNVEIDMGDENETDSVQDSKIEDNVNNAIAFNNVDYKLPVLDIIDNEKIKEFVKKNNSEDLMIPLGLENGNYYGETIESMPNLIVCGTVMSGKSSFVHTIIGTIMLCKKPDEMKLLICDSKRIEYGQYNGSPYLLTPVISDYRKVEKALRVMAGEIDSRLELLNTSGKKNISLFNRDLTDERTKIPSYIVIVDDYDAIGNPDIDKHIWYIAKNGWNTNVYLILVSNHPSSEIISSSSKAHIPARLCFRVPSSRDSMLVLDEPDASKLSGIGKALYKSRYVEKAKKIDVQIFNENELNRLIEYSKKEQKANYEEKWSKGYIIQTPECADGYEEEYDDPLYNEIVEYVMTTGKASASLLQRKYRLGYNRAARIIDLLEERGIIGPQNGSKPREVLVKPEDEW